MAPAWLAKLSGKGGGSIQVRANFPGAAVSLDGTQVGTTGANPVVINDVAPGRHEVAVEKSGYTTTKQEFTLAAGQSLPLSLTLEPRIGRGAAPSPRRAVASRAAAASLTTATARPDDPAWLLGGAGRTAASAALR